MSERIPAVERRATFLGFAAIGLWSLTLGLSRSASERLGPLTAAVAVYLVAGALGLVRWGLRSRSAAVGQGAAGENGGAALPARVVPVLVCGGLFVGYMLALYLAVGRSVSRAQVLEVGLLNYLWPVLTLLGTVTVLRRPARAGRLVAGTALALCGIGLTLAPAAGVPFASVVEAPLPLALALAAAVMWAAYSVLVRRFTEAGVATGPVELYLITTAVLLALPAALADEPRVFSMAALAEVGLLGLTTGVAYLFWERAMARGRLVTVVAASYLTPLLATLFSAAWLGAWPPARLWLGCALLVAGSIVSWSSLRPPGRPTPI
jgi:drug/metabolite transporter (DMT)-like permease